MTETARKITNLRPPEQLSQQNEAREPWMRQKQEPALWHMRFKRYLDLGPKRSLRKALAGEPDSQKATKSAKKKQETKNLSDVSVPGAWKRACKLWRWVERAEAYDLSQLEKQAAFVRQAVVYQPFASKAYRLVHLCGMAEALHHYSNHPGFTLEENILYIKTMQSLFKDISHEMEGLDENTLMIADAHAQKRLLEQANKQKLKNSASELCN